MSKHTITVEDIRAVKHHPACTMPHYDLERGGIEPIRQDFWGNLNYIWCHGCCEWPDHLRDVQTVYEAAHGKGPWWWGRAMYFRWWKKKHGEQHRAIP